jgi:hypothetical protein
MALMPIPHLKKHVAAPLCCILAECGANLGNYRVDSVRLVPLSTFERADGERHADLGASSLLRVVFSSTTDIATVVGSGDLYIWADFCDSEGARQISSFGPYYGDRSRYDRQSPDDPSDNREFTKAQLEAHPPREPATGRFVYTAYLVPSAPARHGQFPRQAYDLSSDHRDLCLRLDHPGYYLGRSRSGMFTLSGASVVQALRAGQ